MAPKLLTERSVSNYGSLPPSTPPIVENEVGTGRRRSKLAHERHDLPAMVGRMIDEMAKHLPERVDEFPAAGRLYQTRVIELRVRHPRQKRSALAVDRLPAFAHFLERFEIRPLRHGWVGP